MRQAEVLKDVLEIRAGRITWDSAGAVQDVGWLAQPRAIAVVMTQECDLEQDYKLRFDDATAKEDVEQHFNALQTVALCEAYPIEELARVVSGYSHKRARDNQFARYHCLEAGATPDSESLPGLVLDLRRVFAIPVVPLYGQLSTEEAKARRVGVIPDLHSHDLMQRSYSYQSRVAVPTAEEQALLEAGNAADVQDELVRLSTSAVDDHV